MPVYEYECGGCRQRVSVYLKSLSSPEPAACPECGSTDFRKAIAGFQFHKSVTTKLAELPSKYEKMVDEAGKDLSMDNIVKKDRLEESRSDPEGKGAPEF